MDKLKAEKICDEKLKQMRKECSWFDEWLMFADTLNGRKRGDFTAEEREEICDKLRRLNAAACEERNRQAYAAMKHKVCELMAEDTFKVWRLLDDRAHEHAGLIDFFKFILETVNE